ncbi:mycofactocin system glycosyltransferase [Nocardioides marmoriginsengisoli]|uniref:Mycofactocin system glycosyltransferase n=1 Tax=Nocardioides marmoriginsengisoli TaxID=661483 RepID=A0A3N0CE32_9ACTN|nr:mycofactocin biosynthesis glycosyltransferase MftF [Nocardioides marmoriginsengisoli]RNL61316.1 mycofactocin system glycosyltransferase [Nocardioides marmoriginsengisoli]
MTLPPGTVVRLAPDVRVRAGGAVLVGGSPTRVTRLSARARSLVHDGEVMVGCDESAALARTLLDAGTVLPVRDSLPSPTVDQVTVVVPVKDREAGLDRLLVGLGGAFEVVVVDDCSGDADGIAGVVVRHGARVIRLDRNVGPAAARNAGLRAATTPYVVFADSDVVIDATTVLELVRHFADPRVAAVAPRIRALPGERSWLGRYEAARSSLDLGARSALVRPLSRVGWLPSAVLAVRRDALDAGFDTRLRVAEDVDLVWRLDAAGWLVRYDAALTAHHEHLVTPASWIARKAYYGTGATPLAARHGGLVAPAVLSPSAAVVAVAALAQRRWSVPVLVTAWLTGFVRLNRRLRSPALAAELTAEGARATGAQTSGLLLRHWWPAALLGAVVSRRVRRAVVVAGVLDAAIEYRRTEVDLDPVRFAAARRLDDVAYGSGVWISAVRGRSLRALVPVLPRRR